MSDAEPQAFDGFDAPAPRKPGMRFPLRAMLLVTSGAALLAAALGPAYRMAAPESRSTLLAFWLTLVAVLAAYLWFQWRGHVRRLAMVGPVRYALQRPDLPNASFLTIIFAWGLLLLSLLAVYAFTMEVISRRSSSENLNFLGINAGGYIGFLLVAALHFIYRPFVHVRPVLLGEHGIVVRRRVLPWASFKRASWHHLLPNWLMLYGSERTYAAATPDAIKSDVEAFVRTKTRFEKDERKLAPGF
jgi:hypothetical protein